MVDFNVCKELASGNIRTPKARLLWPYFENPDKGRSKKAKDGSEKHVYKVALFLPPTADISMLKKAAEAAAVEEFGAEKFKALVEAGKFNTPFLDAFKATQTEKNPGGWEWAKGWTAIRVDSGSKPQVLESNGQSVGDDYSGVYSGRWGFVTVNAKAYPPIDGGKPGVKFYLNNVQLLDHDERLGGGRPQAEDEFEPVNVAGGGEASTDSVFGESSSGVL